MQPKSEIHKKMAMFDEVKNQAPVNSKNSSRDLSNKGSKKSLSSVELGF